MANAVLNIRVVQPRMLTAKQAAEYIGVPLKRMPAICPISPITMPGDIMLYDKHDLDGWVDQMKMGLVDADGDIIGRLQK